MQPPSPEALALCLHETLLAHYGVPAPKEQRDPLSELVLTILSQNTSDTNTARAYAELRRRFPSWEEVRGASPEAVADAIRVGGLADIKAPRIQRILEDLYQERGELSLDLLWEMETAEARAYLERMHGVGPKTAACVLLFSLHKPALPVDTHVHRVTTRIGVIPSGTSAEKAHVMLEGLLPLETYYPFHLNVIRHGRTVCHAARPQCEDCFLRGICAYNAARDGVPKDDQAAETATSAS